MKHRWPLYPSCAISGGSPQRGRLRHRFDLAAKTPLTAGMRGVLADCSLPAHAPAPAAG